MEYFDCPVSVTTETDPDLPKVRIGKLSEFREQSQNANSHNERGIQMLDDSMSEDGYVAPMTAVADGEMIDGSARLDRAFERFGENVIVIEHDGTKPIITVRSDIPNADAEIAKRISLRANRVAAVDLAWDINVLASLKSEGVATEKLWTEKEWQMLVPEGGGKADAEIDTSEADAITERWNVTPGDLFSVGSHKLLCGDSTKPDDLARLMEGEKALVMATDPPYGVAYANWERPNPGIAKPRIANDELVDGPSMQAFLEAMLNAAIPHMDEHAAYYFWHPMLTQGTYVAAAAAAAGILIHRQIIWVKPGLLLGRGDYHWRHELCFYGWRTGNRPPFYGPRNQDTIWEVGYDSDRNDWNHASPKPIALWDRPISNHTLESEVLYEPFCGSGSQMVACENYKRRCFAMELQPDYCATICERMTRAFPGIVIEREKASA